MISGAFTLLISPFDKNMRLDEEGLRVLVRRQVESGIHGIAPLGVTGESPAMTEDEIKRMVEICVEEAGGRCLVAPDTCSNNMEQAENRVRLYKDIGCDYAVVFAPFLVLPKPDGILEFYRRLAGAAGIPLIIHNAAARVGINIEPDTYAKLAAIDGLVGTKDGNKALDHLAKVIHVTRDRDFSVFTGKDTTAFPLLSFGGRGVFTVAGNIIPGVMRDIVEFSLNGEKDKAERLHHLHYELFEALRFETNPMAAKEALALLGLPAGGLRLPLTRLSEAKREILKKTMAEEGLI